MSKVLIDSAFCAALRPDCAKEGARRRVGKRTTTEEGAICLAISAPTIVDPEITLAGYPKSPPGKSGKASYQMLVFLRRAGLVSYLSCREILSAANDAHAMEDLKFPNLLHHRTLQQPKRLDDNLNGGRTSTSSIEQKITCRRGEFHGCERGRRKLRDSEPRLAHYSSISLFHNSVDW